MQWFKVLMMSGVLAVGAVALTGCAEEAGDKAQETTNDVVEASKEAASDAAEYARDAADATGDFLSDSAITGRVKAAFLDADQISASAINVETIDGNVVLSGVVTTDAEADLAEQIAEGIEGVKSVENDIEVQG